MAYEEPAFDVVREYEEFELRQYAPYLKAEIEVSGDFTAVGYQAFRVLADFISGKNRKEENISMTVPVNQQPLEAAGEKIAMTVPVSQAPQSDNGTYVFSFVMPAKYTQETLPKPIDPRIRIQEVPGKLMAVREYSGTWSEGNYRQNESILLKALNQAGLNSIGQPIFARYNSPFSLWFLRRNEVLIEVEANAPREIIF